MIRPTPSPRLMSSPIHQNQNAFEVVLVKICVVPGEPNYVLGRFVGVPTRHDVGRVAGRSEVEINPSKVGVVMPLLAIDSTANDVAATGLNLDSGDLHPGSSVKPVVGGPNNADESLSVEWHSEIVWGGQSSNHDSTPILSDDVVHAPECTARLRLEKRRKPTALDERSSLPTFTSS